MYGNMLKECPYLRSKKLNLFRYDSSASSWSSSFSSSSVEQCVSVSCTVSLTTTYDNVYTISCPFTAIGRATKADYRLTQKKKKKTNFLVMYFGCVLNFGSAQFLMVDLSLVLTCLSRLIRADFVSFQKKTNKSKSCLNQGADFIVGYNARCGDRTRHRTCLINSVGSGHGSCVHHSTRITDIWALCSYCLYYNMLNKLLCLVT